jgi:nicotinate-nucleotide adenylyltransferase
LTGARVGILGGSFNPPHLAHLICAQEAYTQLGLDRVLLMPVNTPPHKRLEDPGAELRLELCRLAIGDDPRFAVSRIELDRPGPSYTVDTLRTLNAQAPEDQLTFIVGGDMALSLPSWHESSELLTRARLGVAERSGAARADVLERLRGLGHGERIEFFEMPRIDISSSLVRRRVADGLSIRFLVPDAVASAIEQTGAYGAPAPAGRA